MIQPIIRTVTTFDRSIFKRRWGKVNFTAGERAGLYIRKIAVNSIKDATRAKKLKTQQQPSKPGKPPKSRAPGHPYKRIFSVPEQLGASVIIGAVGFGAVPTAPEIHEFGLSVRRTLRSRFEGDKRRFITRTIKYPLRATMGPALEKGKSKLPGIWQASLTGGGITGAAA